MSSLVHPFDRLADRYDELWTNTAIGRAQREQVWRSIDQLFRPGDRILDIGCGTGEDAAHLAGRGVTVHAIDPSPAMIEAARRRGGFSAEVANLADLSGTFDGAISNFGALNCVEDLESVARPLERLVRSGGHVALCLIGRFCAWETLYYVSRFDFRKAFRRLNGKADSSLGTVHYPTVATIRNVFARGFVCEQWMGIGCTVPPSYVCLPDRVVGALAACEPAAAALRSMADHRLLILTRK